MIQRDLGTHLDDLDAVASRLIEHPSVHDVVILRRPLATTGEAVAVAYVVPSGPFFPDRLLDHLRTALPDAALPEAFVPIVAIPLTEAGGVDEGALGRLEVLDEQLVRDWEGTLLASPEVDRVAAVVLDREVNLPPLHLSDLLPGRSHPGDAGAVGGSIGQAAGTASGREPRPRRLALSDGGPLPLPEGCPLTMTEALIRTAERCGDGRGIDFYQDQGHQSLSYRELLGNAKSILTGLRARGLKPGDRVLLQIDDLPGHFGAFWACALGGIIPATVAIAPSYEDRNGVVNKLYNAWLLLGEPAILTTERLSPQVANLNHLFGTDRFNVIAIDELADYPEAAEIHPIRPEDVLFIQLTSGSTGVPKCIQERHGSLVHHVLGSREYNDYSEDDVTLNWLPVDHVVPILTYHLKDVFLGCREVHVKTDRILVDPLAWLDLIESHRVSHTWSPNFGFKLVSDALASTPGRAWDLSSVKSFMNAGEQVTLPVVREFLERVAPFGVVPRAMQPAFGMAESCTCMTYNNEFDVEASVKRFLKSSLSGPLVEAEPGADAASVADFVDLGPPMPGVRIRIADGQNRTLPEAQIGRFQIKGAVITPGYLSNEAANREAFVGDGWFNSGDLGFILDGRLFLTGREKEMIIVRGANFYCYEIEDIVNAIDGVLPTFVAACTVSDPESGTRGAGDLLRPQGRGRARRNRVDPDDPGEGRLEPRDRPGVRDPAGEGRIPEDDEREDPADPPQEDA